MGVAYALSWYILDIPLELFVLTYVVEEEGVFGLDATIFHR